MFVLGTISVTVNLKQFNPIVLICVKINWPLLPLPPPLLLFPICSGPGIGNLEQVQKLTNVAILGLENIPIKF